MTEDSSFADFISRIRAGDDLAAEDLVRRYEPLVRREVRLRLNDPRLYRQFDSMDVCQSVMASFFARTALGQYDLHEPGQLIGLLVAMTRNKLAMQARRHRAGRRDYRRVEAGAAEGLDQRMAPPQPTPSRVISAREQLELIRSRLSDDERSVADLRSQGHAWEEIAVALGGTAQARRKQLSRAVDRAERQLGWGGADDA